MVICIEILTIKCPTSHVLTYTSISYSLEDKKVIHDIIYWDSYILCSFI
jgi:hypothetical protein